MSDTYAILTVFVFLPAAFLVMLGMIGLLEKIFG